LFASRFPLAVYIIICFFFSSVEGNILNGVLEMEEEYTSHQEGERVNGECSERASSSPVMDRTRLLAATFEGGEEKEEEEKEEEEEESIEGREREEEETVVLDVCSETMVLGSPTPYIDDREIIVISDIESTHIKTPDVSSISWDSDIVIPSSADKMRREATLSQPLFATPLSVSSIEREGSSAATADANPTAATDACSTLGEHWGSWRRVYDWLRLQQEDDATYDCPRVEGANSENNGGGDAKNGNKDDDDDEAEEDDDDDVWEDCAEELYYAEDKAQEVSDSYVSIF
jgi:hypothetical protein